MCSGFSESLDIAVWTAWSCFFKSRCTVHIQAVDHSFTVTRNEAQLDHLVSSAGRWIRGTFPLAPEICITGSLTGPNWIDELHGFFWEFVLQLKRTFIHHQMNWSMVHRSQFQVILLQLQTPLHVVMPSHLLDHTNHKCEETAYGMLYCYALCISTGDFV